MTQKRSSICILGSGESGMGALRLARKHGLNCFLSDGKSIAEDKKSEIESLGAAYEENGHTIDQIKKFDEIIKSPGIPESASIIQEIRKVGIPIISEIEFASRYTEAKIIGITGSNGKTTTTLLTTHLLRSAGMDAASAGNLGNSFSDLLLETSPSVIVLELSSFQLDDVKEFKPDIAAVLNVTPDHMDRYENRMDLYADAKFNIARNMEESEVFIYNGDDVLIQSRIEAVRAQLKPVKLDEFVLNGAYSELGYTIYNSDESSQILSEQDLPLIGKHNLYNQMVSVQIALELGLNLSSITKGLSTFQNAAHRLEFVEEIGNVRFINDSKATNVDAVFYALDAMRSEVVWIAGGVNKGNDYSQIKELIKGKVHTLVCLGKVNQHLIDEFTHDVEEIHEVLSADDAVQAAMRLANAGDTVLLSPACASFDLFKSYEDRGDQFKAAVKELKRVRDSKHAAL